MLTLKRNASPARIGLTVLVAVVLLAQSASAIELTESKRTGKFLEGDACHPTTQDVFVPVPGIYGMKAVKPLVGDSIAKRGLTVATITDIAKTPRTITWTATPTPENCAARRKLFAYAGFEVSYRRTVRLLKRDAADVTEMVMRKVAGVEWRYGYGKRLGCKGEDPRWGCYALAYIGDASVHAHMRITARAGRRRGLLFDARYRIKVIDDYCIRVENKPAGKCTRTKRGTTTLPGGRFT